MYHNHRIWISHIPYFTSFIFSICNMESSKELHLQIWPKKNTTDLRVLTQFAAHLTGFSLDVATIGWPQKTASTRSMQRHWHGRVARGLGGLRPPYWRTCCRAVMSCHWNEAAGHSTYSKWNELQRKSTCKKKKRGIFGCKQKVMYLKEPGLYMLCSHLPDHSPMDRYGSLWITVCCTLPTVEPTKSPHEVNPGLSLGSEVTRVPRFKSLGEATGRLFTGGPSVVSPTQLTFVSQHASLSSGSFRSNSICSQASCL